MIPRLETPRLLLRPAVESDFEVYAGMLADPLVTRYLGDGKVRSREDAWRHFAMLAGHWVLRGYGMWAIARREAPERMIGRAGFFYPEGWPGLEIGWTVAREHWGHGYATEAASAALEYARKSTDWDQLVSVIHAENTASIRVAEKIGEHFSHMQDVGGQPRSIYSLRLRT